MKILFAEDDPEYRSVISEMLELHGHVVLTATNGNEGFHLLQQFPAELIISDINMPKCTGTQFHEMVRGHEKFKQIPFMYVTGYTILRLSTLLQDKDIDFMINKVPFERVVRMVQDFSRKGSKCSPNPVSNVAA